MEGVNNDMAVVPSVGGDEHENKMAQRRDYILGSMFVFCVLGICWCGYQALNTPKDWDTLQLVDKLMSKLETFAIMILTGHFALSVGNKKP